MRIVRNNEEKGNAFDKHFRELRNSEEKPSSDLWDRLEYRLDDDRSRKKHDHWYYALLFLLIPLTAINIYVNYDFKGLYASLTNEPSLEQQLAANLPGNLPGQLFSTDGASVPMSPVDQPVDALNNGVTNTNSATPGSNGLNILTNDGNASFAPAKKQLRVNRRAAAKAASAVQASTSVGEDSGSGTIGFTGIAANDLIPAERLMLETEATPQDVKFTQARNAHERKQSAIRGFHVGVEGGVNNSMMLMSENTLEPLVSSKIHRKLDLGGYYAVSAGYDFSRKFGMEAELIFTSHQGQKYSELRYGKIPIEGDIDLEYMSVPLLFKYKMSRMGGKALNPRVVNIVAGLQYSRLKEAHVQINDLDLQNATTPFNRDELGIVLGLEYDLFINPNYFFTFGTRASISSDIGAFPFFAPPAAQTYNVLFGVNASFHYLMKKR